MWKSLSGTLLLLSINGISIAGDTASDQVQAEDTTTTAAGVILEYDAEPAASVQEREEPRRDSMDSDDTGSVELIVGGQAEDGVARRTRIKAGK